MKRLCATRQPGGRLGLFEEETPELRPGCVLVRVNCSLVSPGSELGGWDAVRSGKGKEGPGQVFGYSNAGIVEAIGEGVAKFKPGDRVAAIGAGFAVHATHAIVPQGLVVPLPDEVSFEAGSYTMLLATALHGLRRANLQFGDYVSVVGLGLLGVLCARLSELAGHRAIGWEPGQARCAIAKHFGVTNVVQSRVEDVIARTNEFTRGQGLDASIWALSGNADKVWDATMQCMKLSADGHREGRIVVVGHPEFSFKTRPMANVDVVQASRTGPGYHDTAWELGAAYPDVFVRWTTARNVEWCLQLIAEKKLDVTRLTTHRVALGSAEKAIPGILASGEEVLGLVFTMNEEHPSC